MCPPGTDQTTRSPQQWWLLSPSCNEKIRTTLGKTSFRQRKEQSLREESASCGMFELLARPNAISSFVKGSASSSTVIAKQKLSRIESLPAELIAMVLTLLISSKEDVLTFGACSKLLWPHVLRYIAVDYRNSFGRWAGHPLLCTGTWLTVLPPALFKLDPRLEERQIDWDASSGPLRGECPARRWNWDAVSKYENWKDHKGPWEIAANAALKGECPDLYDAVINILQRSYQAVQGLYILRNLTEEKFVRLSTTTDEKGDSKIHVLGAPGISLDWALLLRIRWSNQNSMYSAADMDDHPDVSMRTGAWAGHAFDIVSNDDTLCETWTDVTEAVIQHAFSLGSVESLSKGYLIMPRSETVGD